MKKIIFFLLIVLPLFSLAGCEKKSNEDQKTNEETAFHGSMKDLVEKGQSVKCTFSFTDDDQTMTGTVYVAGEKKMRSDYEMITDNQTIKSSMINDGDILYTWSNMMPQGIKMNMKEMENLKQEDTAAGGENLEQWNENMDFKCVKWSVDKDLFEPPKDMEFLDWTEMIKNLSKNLGS